jgi:hypothetical protein
MYRFAIGFILISIYGNAQAQVDVKTAVLDSITYTQFVEKNWASLLDSTNQILKRNEGFYNLYLRAAIASNALQKPYKEQYYLQLAQQNYPNDSNVLPQLYVNYLKLGQYPQALRINKIITNNTLKENQYREPIIYMANIESGYKKCNDETIYKPLYYGQVGFGFRIHSTTMYNAISYLTQNSYYGKLNQYQYFITATIPLQKNWNVLPAFHWLEYNITDSSPFIPDSVLNGQSIVYGVSISKLYKSFLFNVGMYNSTLNQENQFQIQPGVTWFPFSNNTLSLNTTLNYLTEKNILTASYSATVIPVKSIALTLAYLKANTRFYTEQSGYLVNNSFDITKDRIMSIVNWNITSKWIVYGVYLHEKKVENVFETPYTYNMGLIGLKKIF